MFEQVLILIPIGAAVGLAARAVCLGHGGGSAAAWDVSRWVWPAVAVAFLGVIALGPRGFAAAAASVAFLVGLPLLIAGVWRRVCHLFDQPSAETDPSFNRMGNAPRGPLGTRLDEVDSYPSPHEFLERCSDIPDDGSETERMSLSDDAVRQWLKRSRLSASEERIEGMTRAEFGSGQKQIALHVAFCPPLPVVPVVSCELLDDVDVRLRVTSVQAFGLRIEAKRSTDVDQPLAAAIQFSAVAGTASAPRQSSRSAA
jgi:hypothetical protein